MTASKSPSNASITTQAINEIREDIRSLTNTIRGNNGYPGMVAQMNVMQNQMQEMAAAFKDVATSILETQKAIEQINAKGCEFGKTTAKHEAPPETDKTVVTWAWLRDKLAVPIVLAILLGIIYGLPRIVELINP